ncbi:MAG TPA: RidA family protein [Phycisphaerae bacterium]|nr:RidA family protein [Phycisphaerae bacterium]
MTPEQRIQSLGLELPKAPAPVGAYAPAVRTGNLIFTAGQIPMKDGELLAAGKVPTDVPQDVAGAAAMQCALNALAAVQGALGDGEAPGELERVARIVRMNVFVNSAAGFTDQAKVANAASELLIAAFGEPGRHTRCAIGAAELPLNAAVELDLVVEVR